MCELLQILCPILPQFPRHKAEKWEGKLTKEALDICALFAGEMLGLKSFNSAFLEPG